VDVPEFLIERLKEQIALAPELQENDVPGGTLDDMIGAEGRLVLGINFAGHIPRLQAVEGGRRRYSACLQAAMNEVGKLRPIFAEIAPIRDAVFPTQDAKNKAMARLKDHEKKIVAICQTAIGHLERAQKVLDEGDMKQAKLAGNVA
jgi:hypothetical protein